jgi:hypothetical protein
MKNDKGPSPYDRFEYIIHSIIGQLTYVKTNEGGNVFDALGIYFNENDTSFNESIITMKMVSTLCPEYEKPTEKVDISMAEIMEMFFPSCTLIPPLVKRKGFTDTAITSNRTFNTSSANPTNYGEKGGGSENEKEKALLPFFSAEELKYADLTLPSPSAASRNVKYSFVFVFIFLFFNRKDLLEWDQFQTNERFIYLFFYQIYIFVYLFICI